MGLFGFVCMFEILVNVVQCLFIHLFVYSLVGIQCPYVFVQCLYRENIFKTVNTIQFKYDGTCTLILVYEGEGLLLVFFPNILNVIVHICKGEDPEKLTIQKYLEINVLDINTVYDRRLRCKLIHVANPT